MTSQDKYMAMISPQPPLTAFRRQKNLKDLLISAKVPEKWRPVREQKGMTKQSKEKQRKACPFIKNGCKIRI